jgi:hypothetical protein
MKDRLSNITFPTSPTEIAERNDKIGHTEYWQYYYYKTFWKFSAIYRLLSDEKDIPDDALVDELAECMKINGNYDCRIQIDKKWRYKNHWFSAKTYAGLIHLITKKIREKKLSYNHGYYILCRIADDSDNRLRTKEHIQHLLNP